ncbi:MAG TPA: hypothetical protein VGT02_15845 [Methylomirabilota bacterium]|jgi:hypothetical protein|nr:hypothetical protein [Methylomirabilota bacterium]
MRSTAKVRGAAVALVLAMLAGCSTAAVTPSASVTTLMPDSERWFKLSWEAVPERDGAHQRVRGYVENTYGEAASKVQLLAQALDGSGQVVGQKVEWLSGVVPGFGRAYFEIPKMPKAEHYRVTVWAYERIQGRGDGWVIR